MRIDFARCQLTAKDFHICQAMLAKLAATGSPLVPLLRQKIETGIVVLPEQIDPLVVTLNSRVDFQIDDGASETRIVVQGEFRHGLVGLTLPVSTVRGLALLGRRQGQSCLFDEHGRMRTLIVRRVLYQPEARRFMRDAARRDGQPAKVIDLAAARSGRSAGGHRRGGAVPPS